MEPRVNDEDILFEEALMENHARNEFKRRQDIAIKDYQEKSRWSRFVNGVKIDIQLAVIEIRDFMKRL
jgi:hypothetical protein